MPFPEIHPASERSLLIRFSEFTDLTVSRETVQRVHRLVALLDRSSLPGILQLTPAYSSLLIEFNPLHLRLTDLIEHIHFCMERIGHVELPAPAQMEIPVFYGGQYGPDLAICAESLNMSVSQLVEAHCAQTFSVAFFGFLPGFAYLEGWPSQWALPRLDSPRPKVPRGSVAIAGVQAGIYPVESPGGWRLLGQTPLAVIDTARPNFSLFDLGAQLRFYPSNPAAW